jgi:hypothetical protein
MNEYYNKLESTWFTAYCDGHVTFTHHVDVGGGWSKYDGIFQVLPSISEELYDEFWILDEETEFNFTQSYDWDEENIRI